MTPLPTTNNTPSWWSILSNHQVLLIVSVRILDFAQIASLQACAYPHLSHLQLHSTPDHISSQLGYLQGAFTAAQVFSAWPWGRVSDVVGCRIVLVTGLVGTALSCIGVAFAPNFAALVAWRIFAGLVNGTVPAARAALAESVPKRYHPMAFGLLVLSFSLGNLLGPVGAAIMMKLGMQALFGTSPFAGPSLLMSLLLLLDGLLVHLYLEETLPDAAASSNITRHLLTVLKSRKKHPWSREDLQQNPVEEDLQCLASHDDDSSEEELEVPPPSWTLSLRNHRFLLTLAFIACLDFHLGSFAKLYPVLLSSPRQHQALVATPLLASSSGLGLRSSEVSFWIAVLGGLGAIEQLTIAPWITSQYGPLTPCRLTALLFPLYYVLSPYLTLIPANQGLPLSTSLFFLSVCVVTARTFFILATLLLTNESVPDPTMRATVHGISSAVSGCFRAIGSICGGELDVLGSRSDIGGALPWWTNALVSLLGGGIAWSISIIKETGF